MNLISLPGLFRRRTLEASPRAFRSPELQSELSHWSEAGPTDALGSLERSRHETLREVLGCTTFQVQLLGRLDSRLIAEYALDDSGAQSLRQQALGLLEQFELAVDRLVHKVYLRGRRPGDRRWKTIELELGELSGPD